MKFRNFLSTAVSALILLSASALPVSAEQDVRGCDIAPFGARLSTYEENISIPEAVQVMSIDEAAAVIRNAMKNRVSDFSVVVPKAGFSNSEDAVKKMLAEAMKETSSGTEGDYLRFALKSYRYDTGENRTAYSIAYKLEYYTTAEQEQETDRKIAEITSYYSLYDRSKFEIIRAVYDYISENVKYAEVEPDESTITDFSIFTAYGAAVNGTAVCQGYAQLCYRLLKDAGISCRIISGTSRGIRHTWNIAELDGVYYLLDSTWDSILGGSDGVFFMKGSEDFDELSDEIKHIPVYEYETIFSDYESEAFKAEYPLSAKKAAFPVYTTGDVDGNSIIDGRDASAVLNAYAIASVGRAYPFCKDQMKASDVTGDGMTDGKDASDILAFYAASSAGKADDIRDFLKNRT
ncbi:MAG: hypothetical protein J5926_06220 [Ruminococcus sp.]|nr:hypothetical protein [Ruminococcus sp.]